MIARLLTLILLLFAAPAAASPSWVSEATRARVVRDGAVVIHVLVPLCSNAQINCGQTPSLGRPGGLRTNLYWGAMYGAKRFFARRDRGWQPLTEQAPPTGVLERAVFRRHGPGEGWGRTEPVEVLVVLDAIHGDHIDDAVGRFFRRATEGGSLTVRDGSQPRTLPVAAVGYAGHNRLMDGLVLPPARDRGEAIPSFVLACRSRAFFSDALVAAGSRPLVTTETLMAPEGYLVEAIARAVGDGASAHEVRQAAIVAYARWQRIERRAARRVFVPSRH